MATLERLQESLDVLERFLPGMLSRQSDPEHALSTFNVRADLIRESAGTHVDYVRSRLDAMLADSGLDESGRSTPGMRSDMTTRDRQSLR